MTSADSSTSSCVGRVHGGADAHGVARHDFSTNSHACGPCPEALAAVQQADARAYPDPAYVALQQRLAQFHGVAPSRILLAASASEFIFRVTALAAQRGSLLSLPPHSYGDYAQAASAYQLQTGAAASADQPRLQWACEPSSPLGQAHAGLVAQTDALKAGSLLVLDRAYEPLRLSGHASLSAESLDRVWQLWTPNKALGLTGVRAAYAIAPVHADEDVARLQALCPSWPVGSHGVAMLDAWASPHVQAWLADTLQTLRGWKARQLALCTDLGWVCQPSQANFFCAQPKLPQGVTLQAVLTALRARGVQLRHAASFGLPGYVRVSVQAPAAQDALHNGWQHIIKELQ